MWAVNKLIFNEAAGTSKVQINTVNSAIAVQTYHDSEFNGTKGSKFRISRHYYLRIIAGDFGHGLDKIILEISSFAYPYPTVLKVVQSYIGEYLLSQDEVYWKAYEPISIELYTELISRKRLDIFTIFKT